MRVLSIPLTKIQEIVLILSLYQDINSSVMLQYILGIPVVLVVPVLLAHHDHPNKTKFIRLVVHQKKIML